MQRDCLIPTNQSYVISWGGGGVQLKTQFCNWMIHIILGHYIKKCTDEVSFGL